MFHNNPSLPYAHCMCGDKSKNACPSKVVFFCEKELNGVDQKDSIRKLMFVTRAKGIFGLETFGVGQPGKYGCPVRIVRRLLFFAHPHCNLADTRCGQPRPRMLYPVPSVSLARRPSVYPPPSFSRSRLSGCGAGRRQVGDCSKARSSAQWWPTLSLLLLVTPLLLVR